jgi:tRNA nucleotidyltransferase/poly(A) polymerase
MLRSYDTRAAPCLCMKIVPPELEKILRDTPQLQRAYLVGGCVRDALAGLPPGKDFDV